MIELEVLNDDIDLSVQEDVVSMNIEGTGYGTVEYGGHYTPSVDDEGNLTWTASKDWMPAIPGSNIRGPDGTVSFDELTPAQHASLVGPRGPRGYPGIQVSTEEPTDPDVYFWIDPDDGGTVTYATGVSF